MSNVYVYETYSLEVNSRTFLARLSLVAHERLKLYERCSTIYLYESLNIGRILNISTKTSIPSCNALFQSLLLRMMGCIVWDFLLVTLMACKMVVF